MKKERMSINEIQNMSLKQAKGLCSEHMRIKDHDIYCVDFGGCFGYSALVFYNNMHIYYANDYQLHHEYLVNDGDTTKLKEYYIKSLNNKLFTNEELSEPLKDYKEYTDKDYYIRNYYGMRSPYISMFFIGTDEEREERRKETELMHFSSITFAYYYDSTMPGKIESLYKALQEQKADTVNNFEYQKRAFKHEMFNYEYSINWQADYDVLSAFGQITYKADASLNDYFNELNFNEIQRKAYRAARQEYYEECNY